MCNKTGRFGRVARSMRSTCVYLFSVFAPINSYTVVTCCNIVIAKHLFRQGTINDIAQAFIELDGGRVGRTHEEVHKITIVHLFTHLPSATWVYMIWLCRTWLHGYTVENENTTKARKQSNPKGRKWSKKYLKISKMTTTSIFGIWSLLSAFVSIPMKILRDCIRDLSFSIQIPMRFVVRCAPRLLPSSSKYSMSLLATPVRRNSGATEMAETCPCQLGWAMCFHVTKVEVESRNT